MKQQWIIAGLCLFIAQASTFAQTEKKGLLKRAKITEFNAQSGSTMGLTVMGEQADFLQLAPNSLLAQTDLTDYTKTGGFGPMMQAGGPISGIHGLYVGLQFREEPLNGFLRQPVLRLGFTFMNTNNISASYSRSTITPYDTLTSSQTGAQTLVDSVFNQNINMNYQTQQLRLDGALIFQTTDKYRFSFHTGIGVSLGTAISSRTTINYLEDRYISSSDDEDNDGDFYSYNEDAYESVSETVKNKNGFAFTGYIPVGFNMRLGKKREFWKHLNIYAEMRPGLYITAIPELATQTTFGLTSNLGLKIKW